MKNKGILIILIVVLALGLGGVGFYFYTQMNKPEENDDGEIPMEQIMTVEYENQIISTLAFEKDDTKMLNVSFTVGFALDSKNKAAEKMKTQLEEKNGFITHKIRNLLKSVYSEEVTEIDFEEEFAEDILDMIQEELDTDAIIEIYFKDFLYSVKNK